MKIVSGDSGEAKFTVPQRLFTCMKLSQTIIDIVAREPTLHLRPQSHFALTRVKMTQSNNIATTLRISL